MSELLETERIRHGGVTLALHTLKRNDEGDGRRPALLLLHALHGSSADWPAEVAVWPGAIYALDFSGHGVSDWLQGRGYSPEVFAAEADQAIARVQERAPALYLAGAGVGAYVALLLGGARTDVLEGVLLLPGAGLEGGGAIPEEIPEAGQRAWEASVSARGRGEGEASPDPLVDRCSRDVRPSYYSEEFAKAAPPLHVPEIPDLPAWLRTTLEHGRVQRAPSALDAALEQLAAS